MTECPVEASPPSLTRSVLLLTTQTALIGFGLCRKFADMRRVFLGWDRPALALAVEYLIQRYAVDGRLNLSDVVVAVPGGRAGRRLEELLIQRAAEVDPTWFPPTIVTVGRLAEHFYETKYPFASDLVQQLAWIEALRRVSPEETRRVAPKPPENDDTPAWLELGKMLARLHRELSAEGLYFEDAANCIEQLSSSQDESQNAAVDLSQEAKRWRALDAVQKAYLAILDSLELWDMQTARFFAVRHGLCRLAKDVVLIGTVDLTRTQRSLFDQAGERVTALVFAPEEEQELFDEYGCVRPSDWLERRIAVDDSRIEQAAGPSEQADAVARWLASLGDRYATSDITIGVPHPEVIPYVEQRLEECGLASRYGVGAPISRSPLYALLRSVADFLDSRRYDAFAALVRHPSIAAWLERRMPDGADYLTKLDKYQTMHLPRTIAQGAGQAEGPSSSEDIVGHVTGLIDELLAPLSHEARQAGTKRRSVKREPRDWSLAIAELLGTVFGDRPLDARLPTDRSVMLATAELRDVLRGFENLPEQLSPNVSAAEAIDLALRELEGRNIAASPDAGAIELLGWLELPFDDAPALAVTALNEGIIPSSVNADEFLPNRLRRVLGIEDNDRRYARDAYALTMIVHSRPDVRLIMGRRSSVGDPLLPSRLLFACDDATMASRARRFFDDASPSSRLVLGATSRTDTSVTFETPAPRPLESPVRSMRVTEFRDYLACPYRYYLRHRLKLEAINDRAVELDGAAFGSLAHDVLKQFGEAEPELRDATEPETIRDFLRLILQRETKRRFGDSPPAAVRVQVEQLRARLDAFARWQADWASQGWRIEQVEIAPAEGTAFLGVDGQRMELRGRIDRIDVNIEDERRIVFDYKTSDQAKSPDASHRKGCGDNKEWIDLQLPLYRHLLPAIGMDDDVQLAYINLPKDTGKVGASEATWDDATLHNADETARRVIRAIWQEAFWPPTDPPPPFSEDYAAICRDASFGPAQTGDNGDNDAGGANGGDA